MTNHLGNVLTTVSDQKLGDDQDEPDGFADYYDAVPLTVADYFPFGLEMDGRTISADNHRFALIAEV